MNIVDKAARFASLHHAAVGQVRKYKYDPYIVHPASVAKIVASVSDNEAMIAAAWLHDTVEDTTATIEDIRAEFGKEISILVEMLTDVSVPSDGNRAKRKSIDRNHTALASPAAKTIKLADLIDNSSSIIEHDPKFAKVYLEEKRLLLEVLTQGDKSLWNQAKSVLDQWG